MLTRREAVTAMGAATLSMGLRCSPSAANQRVGALSPIGVQLYTVRSAMSESVERTLERVAAIGYTEVEFAGYFDRSAAEIRRLLDDNGLTAPATHIAVESMETEWEAIVDYAATVGHQYLVVAWIAPSNRGTLDDYRRMVERFNRIGERAQESGMTFGYHNHDFEFTPTDGAIPYDTIMSESDPNLVAFEMDLFWTVKGGADPLAYFDKYPGRFPMVHVKDMAPDGSMVDVGAGQIDFAAIFAHSATAGIKHYFVEHDNPGDAFDSIQASYTHLHSLDVP